MPTHTRSEIVADDEVGIYHCIDRRAWLCGDDPVSDRSYEHRKDWVRGTRLLGRLPLRAIRSDCKRLINPESK